LIFYTLYIVLLDKDIRKRVYGIEFTLSQLQIIRELIALLDEYNENREEKEKKEEKEDECIDEKLDNDNDNNNLFNDDNNSDSDSGGDDDCDGDTYNNNNNKEASAFSPAIDNLEYNDNNPHSSLLKIKVSKKLLQLFIEYII
jgi:hypothetical protein